MSSVWTAILPVIVAPVATALVAGYAGKFGSGGRLRRELKEDTDLLSASASAGLSSDDVAADHLAATISPRMQQLVALTRYPRVVAAELPALILILTVVALMPATYLVAERSGSSVWYPVLGVVVALWLGIFVGASWLLLGRTLPRRAHDRLRYLEEVDPSLRRAREDAEVVGLWAWSICVLFYLTLSAWLGQIVFLVLAASGATSDPPSVRLLVTCVCGVFVLTAVVVEGFTAPLQRQVFLTLWGGLLIDPPGVASRLQGFRVAAHSLRLRPLQRRHEAFLAEYESRSDDEDLHGVIVDATGPTLDVRDMPGWPRPAILHIRDSGPTFIEFDDKSTRAQLLLDLAEEHGPGTE